MLVIPRLIVIKQHTSMVQNARCYVADVKFCNRMLQICNIGSITVNIIVFCYNRPLSARPDTLSLKVYFPSISYIKVQIIKIVVHSLPSTKFKAALTKKINNMREIKPSFSSSNLWILPFQFTLLNMQECSRSAYTQQVHYHIYLSYRYQLTFVAVKSTIYPPVIPAYAVSRIPDVLMCYRLQSPKPMMLVILCCYR